MKEGIELTNSLNLDLLKKKSIPNKDNSVAKNIIDIIFKNTETNIKNTNKITAFWKNIVLRQLPSVVNFSKEHIDDMSPSDVKILLDSIQSELDKRK